MVTFYGAGNYEQPRVYRTLDQRGADVIIPQRKNAITRHVNRSADPWPLDECLR